MIARRLSLAVFLLLAAGASARAGDQTFDCSTPDGRAGYNGLLARLANRYGAQDWERDFGTALGQPRFGDSSPPGRCSMTNWCLALHATIRIVVKEGSSIAQINSHPPYSCSESWKPTCTGGCSQTTDPLAKGDSSSSAVVTRGTDGKIRIDGAAPASSPASGTGDFGGVTFSSKSQTYKVQFKTGFIFHLKPAGSPGAGTYEDTGATLDQGVMAGICAADASIPCDELSRGSCAAIGLTPTHGGKTYKDARGNRWVDEKDIGCRRQGVGAVNPQRPF